MTDDVLLWWIGVQVISLITLPLSWCVFRALPVGGYAFHKLMGLLLFAFIAWSLMMLGVLPNTRWALFVALGMLALLSVATVRFVPLRLREHPELGRQALVVEGLFLILFCAGLRLRCISPAINGSEKFMDFMFLNSILRSTAFPPQDAWAAGLPINYYYFGHVIVAYLTKLTSIQPGVAFNAAQALFLGLSGLGAYGVAYTLAAVDRGQVGERSDGVTAMRPTLVGLLAMVLLLLMGNLFAASKLLTDPAFLHQGFFSGVGWQSARVIETMDHGRLLDQPITEFPAFTVFLGDMHAHFMAMPFVLLAVGVAFLWFVKPDYERRPSLDRVVRTVSSAIVFGSLVMLTAWFVPACVALLAAGVLVSLRQRGQLRSAGKATVWGAITAILAAVCVAPFYRTFASPIGGVQIVPYRTSFRQFCLIFGAFLVPALAALCVAALGGGEPTASSPEVKKSQRGRARRRIRRPAAQRPLTMRSVLLVVWIVTAAAAALAPSYAVVLLALGLVVGVVVLVWHRHRSQARVFALLLAGGAFVLVVVPEIFYLEDSGAGGPYMRANTVFKFHYQAWIFLAPACAFFSAHVARFIAAVSRAGAWLFRGVVTMLIGAGLFYTVWVAADLYGPCQTLDGTVNAIASADDSKAIQWLLTNAAPASRLVEAASESYSNGARVSVFTGIPTVLGWRRHEWNWRGDHNLMVQRSGDVDVFYAMATQPQAVEFFRRYGIDYVFVGEEERKRYGARVERLVQWFPTLYHSGSVYVLAAR